MSTLSYNVGYTLGAVARGFLRVMKSPKHTAPASPLIATQLLQAAPHPSGQVLETMRQVPAIVRLKGVDLNSWYEANTRVVALKKPARQLYLACLIYILESPFFYIFADNDDAPGVVIIGMILAGAALVIALFASMLQKLLSQAIRIKQENDLTI